MPERNYGWFYEKKTSCERDSQWLPNEIARIFGRNPWKYNGGMSWAIHARFSTRILRKIFEGTSIGICMEILEKISIPAENFQMIPWKMLYKNWRKSWRNSWRNIQINSWGMIWSIFYLLKKKAWISEEIFERFLEKNPKRPDDLLWESLDLVEIFLKNFVRNFWRIFWTSS